MKRRFILAVIMMMVLVCSMQGTSSRKNYKYIGEIMKRIIICLFFSLTLSACAGISNEGKVDFRRTNTEHTVANNDNHNQQTFIVKNFSLGKKAGFNKGDSLSLHLRSAYISNYSENIITPYITKAFTRQWGKTNGEIAIIANAFEEGNGKELSFEDMRQGRVVFYSDDVHEGQLLNFDNMPIYGPMTYNGAPFVFRVAIFELDIISDQLKAMLNTIAHAGATAYPPASPVLEVLNGIGSTFFEGDKIDTEFRYTMILDHKSGSDEINHLMLESGNYVFIRVENRNTDVPWDDLYLDENKAMVYKKEKDGNGKPQHYTENTYLVVEINKNISDVSIDLAENNFSGLIASLAKKDREAAVSWTSTNDALMKVAIERSQINNFGRAKEILSDLGKSDVKPFEKRIEAEELFMMIAKSIDDKGETLKIDPSKPSESYDLSDSQIKYILKNIRELVDSKINAGNWETFKLTEIYKGFLGILDEPSMTRKINDIERKAILDIVAPIP